jgi:hypothetical protein
VLNQGQHARPVRLCLALALLRGLDRGFVRPVTAMSVRVAEMKSNYELEYKIE